MCRSLEIFAFLCENDGCKGDVGVIVIAFSKSILDLLPQVRAH